jgi:hypothetical protein
VLIWEQTLSIQERNSVSFAVDVAVGLDSRQGTAKAVPQQPEIPMLSLAGFAGHHKKVPSFNFYFGPGFRCHLPASPKIRQRRFLTVNSAVRYHK